MNIYLPNFEIKQETFLNEKQLSSLRFIEGNTGIRTEAWTSDSCNPFAKYFFLSSCYPFAKYFFLFRSSKEDNLCLCWTNQSACMSIHTVLERLLTTLGKENLENYENFVYEIVVILG